MSSSAAIPIPRVAPAFSAPTKSEARRYQVILVVAKQIAEGEEDDWCEGTDLGAPGDQLEEAYRKDAEAAQRKGLACCR